MTDKRRVAVRAAECNGKICELILDVDGSIYIEIKVPGQKNKRIARIDTYLKILTGVAA